MERQKYIIDTKVRFYRSTTPSVFLYGSECWTVKNEQEHKILSAEMNWL